MNLFHGKSQKTNKCVDFWRSIFNILRKKVWTILYGNLQKPCYTYVHSHFEKEFPKEEKTLFQIHEFHLFFKLFFLQIFPNILLKDIEIMMTNKSVTKKRSVISKLHFFIVLVYVTTSVTLASPVDLKNDVITSSRHNLKLLVDTDATPNIAQFETSHSKEQILAKREEQIQNLATSVLGSSRWDPRFYCSCYCHC